MTPSLRSPKVTDGRGLWEVARRSGSLDLNSPYAYLLLATHFADTSVVAEVDGEVVGFVAAYRPPSDPDALFVWQVAVDESQRRTGLGGALLDAAIHTSGGGDARFLSASVTPSNGPSMRLFRSFATRQGGAFEIGPWLEPEHFPVEHEAEQLVRIGPLAAPRSAEPATTPAPTAQEMHRP